MEHQESLVVGQFIGKFTMLLEPIRFGIMMVNTVGCL